MENKFRAYSNGVVIELDLQTNRYSKIQGDHEVKKTEKEYKEKSNKKEINFESVNTKIKMKDILHFIIISITSRRLKQKSLSDISVNLKKIKKKHTQPVIDIEIAIKKYQILKAILPYHRKCIEDSICAFLFLNQYGLKPELKIGVVFPPFLAHAWVEVDDILVNDIKQVTEQYSEIFKIESQYNQK